MSILPRVSKKTELTSPSQQVTCVCASHGKALQHDCQELTVGHQVYDSSLQRPRNEPELLLLYC